MSARTGVRTLPDFLADIDERLRRVERQASSRPALPDHGDLPGLEDDDHPYIKEAEFTIAGQILVGIGNGQLVALDVPADSDGAALVINEAVPWRVGWSLAATHTHDGTGSLSTVLGGTSEGSPNAAVASGIRSFAAGDAALSEAYASIAQGYGAHAAGEGAIAIGADNSGGALAPQGGAQALSPGDIAIGVDAIATQGAMVVIGEGAGNLDDAGQWTILVGALSQGENGATEAVGIGREAVVSAAKTAAIGGFAWAAAPDAVAVGYEAAAEGEKSLALGPSALVTSLRGVGLGYFASVEGEDGVGLGSFATVDHASAVAVGAGTSTTAIDQVALGARHLELSEVTAPGTPAANAGRLYLDAADGALKLKKDSGSVVDLEAAGSAHTIKEDGSALTQRAGLNFVNGLVATDDAGNNETDINVAYGSPVGLANANADGAATTAARSNHEHKRDVRVAKAGSDVGTRNRLNFIEGSGVTLTVADDSGSDEVDITIAASAAGIAEGRPEAGGTVYLTKPGVELFDTSTGTLTQNESRYEPFLVSTAIAIDQLVIEVTTNVASSNIRLGIYEADADWQPGALVVEGAVSSATTGVKTLSVTETLTPGRYVAAINTDSVGVAYRRWQGGSRYAGFLTTIGATPFIGKLSVGATYGAFPDPGTAWTAAAGTAGPMFHGVLLRVSTP